MTLQSLCAPVPLRRAVAVALSFGASIALATDAAAAGGLLNDTGQDSCYDYAQHWQAAACTEPVSGDEAPFPRQDGRYGRDAAARLGRLHKTGGGEGGFDLTRVCMNGDAEGEGACPPAPPEPGDPDHPAPADWACTRDNVTGLTWALGSTVRASWSEAASTEAGSFIAQANAAGRCGLDSGWRLPERREMFSLNHLGRMMPAVDPAYFPVLASAADRGHAFWTTDVYRLQPDFNWVSDFISGGLATFQCREVTASLLCASLPPGVTRWEANVLLVNGQWQPAVPRAGGPERWQVSDDGQIVADALTGLVWDRCSWGQSGVDCAGEGEVFHVWGDAMQVALLANRQRHKGYYDWRLPNARELETLVDIDAALPAIDVAAFPNTPPLAYWTASSSAGPGLADLAWNVSFQAGLLFLHDKVPPDANPEHPDRSRVRLVRGGQPFAAFDGVGERLFMADFESTSAQRD